MTMRSRGVDRVWRSACRPRRSGCDRRDRCRTCVVPLVRRTGRRDRWPRVCRNSGQVPRRTARIRTLKNAVCKTGACRPSTRPGGAGCPPASCVSWLLSPVGGNGPTKICVSFVPMREAAYAIQSPSGWNVPLRGESDRTPANGRSWPSDLDQKCNVYSRPHFTVISRWFPSGDHASGMCKVAGAARVRRSRFARERPRAATRCPGRPPGPTGK